ncbi:hypothetical protein ABH922_000056 [Rhodococcus sp. 27YEA15]|uniref:hypothetical protein n=1 Tax=Rhodococcus sp. 27YEA15 TaxID=3156259 RepID=UPI003C7CBD96
MSCATTVSAPDEGTAGKRVTWIVRQLKASPFNLGSKRSGTAAGFINRVTVSAETFYSEVVQPLREWVPAASKASDLPRDEQADDCE